MTESYVSRLFKFSGAGNDFVVLDGRQGDVSAFREPQRIGSLCREYRTDGLMILTLPAAGTTRADFPPLPPSCLPPGRAPEPPQAAPDFVMEFYNPDGSGGMMCGNGGRCIVAFADYLGLRPAAPDGTWLFQAPDGLHEARILGKTPFGGHVHPRTWVGGGARGLSVREADETDSGRGRSERSERSSTEGSLPEEWTVRLKMIDVQGIEPAMGGYFLNTGTRHLVQFVGSVDDMDVDSAAKPLRWDAAFAPEGTNVNFVEPRADGLHVRTFEKGVEGETLACGTGLTASALAACRHGIPGQPVPSEPSGRQSYRLQCRRGDWLQVDFLPIGPDTFTQVYLTGPAELVPLSKA